MINVPENELFSAYLDGELTAAEQADIERLLATSPAARQLLEELRALSSTLQSLPVHKLDEDLSQQVLRLAERRMLSGQTDSDPFPQDPIASPGRWRAVVRRLSQPRIWVWPGLAVAVGLLLMILQPEQARQPAGNHVALAPAAAPSGPAEPAAIGAAAEADREASGDTYHFAAKAPAGGERPHSAKQLAFGSLSVEMERHKAAESPRLAAMPAASSAPAAPPAPAPETTPEALFRPMKAAKQGLSAGTVAAKEKVAEAARKAPEQVLIVRCDVTRQAIELRIVEQVLAKRQVVLAEAPAKDGVDRDRAAGRRIGRVEKEEAKPEAIAWEASQAEPADKRAVDAGRIVYLHAEATPAQLEAVLADLQSRPEMVRSLSKPSVVDGPVAYGEYGGGSGLFFGKAPPTMKKKGDVAANQAPGLGVAGSAVAGRPAEPSQRSQMNGQMNFKNQPTLADPADGAATANQMRNVQIQAGMANSTAGAATANQSQNVQSPPGMPGSAGGVGAAGLSQVAGSKKGLGGGMGGRMPAKSADETRGQQEMPAQMTQRAIDATQAGGTRMAGPGGMPAVPQTQPRDRCRVVFVLRAVDANRIVSEKAGKAQTGEAKAAGAKPAPARAEAAAPAEPSKPAAAAQPAPSAK